MSVSVKVNAFWPRKEFVAVAYGTHSSTRDVAWKANKREICLLSKYNLNAEFNFDTHMTVVLIWPWNGLYLKRLSQIDLWWNNKKKTHYTVCSYVWHLEPVFSGATVHQFVGPFKASDSNGLVCLKRTFNSHFRLHSADLSIESVMVTGAKFGW